MIGIVERGEEDFQKEQDALRQAQETHRLAWAAKKARMVDAAKKKP